MDLIATIIFLFVIYYFKIAKEVPDTTVTSTVVTDAGEEHEVEVKESSLVVGKNLMLLREPRAYHKILDEMGLGK